MTTAYRARPGRPRLGELLIAAGILDDAGLAAALAEQRRWGDRLGRTLVHMGLLSEDALAQALSRQLQVPTCRPDLAPLPPDATGSLGVLACERYGVMPLGVEGGVLRVATTDPSNAPLFDELAAITGLRVEPVIATESSIGRAIRRHYYGEPIQAEPALPEADSFLPPEPTSSGITVELTPIDPIPAANEGAAGVPEPAPGRAPPANATSALDFDVEVAADADPVLAGLREAVDRIESDLAREVRVLRGLVETLIERGVLDREEFLQHVRERRE